jgi:hypothetical protein
MEQNDYNIGIRPAEATGYSAGVAYIVIPTDLDREKYIKECYRTSTVSIFSEHNGFCNRVPIDNFSINFITFPNTKEEFGTLVSFLLDPVHKKPIIIGIYSNGISDLKENQFKFKRELNGQLVEISGSTTDGSLGLNVKSEKGGQVFITVGSVDKSGKINLSVSGDVNITASNETNITQYNKCVVATIDPDNDSELSVFEQNSTQNSFTSTDHLINAQNVKINDGEEPFLLGKKVKKFLDDLIEEIGNSTVTTMLGQMPLLNKAQIVAYKEKTEALLSTIAFINK